MTYRLMNKSLKKRADALEVAEEWELGWQETLSDALEALRKNEARQQAMIINISDVIAIIDANGINRYKSPNIEKWFGWKPEEVIGMSTWDNIHPLDTARLQSVFADLLTFPGKQHTDSCRYRCRDGSFKWIEITAVNLLDDPDINGILLNYHDITRRKESEDALAESEQKFRLIFEYAPLGLFRFNEKSLITACNRCFVSIMGSSTDALIGLCLLDLPDKRIVEEIKKVLSGNTGFFEGEYFSTTGHKLVPLRCIFNPLFSQDGSPMGGVGIIEDISERQKARAEHKKLEAQFNHVQKMESMGRLAGGVAHDFNNMLGVINGYAENALNMLQTADPLYPDIKEILNAGRRSAALVGQLLAYARKQLISPVPMDLNITVTAMLTMLQRMIGEDIDLSWKPGQDLWQVNMDPAQIDQILANLAVNARDAITGVGRIIIESNNMAIDEQQCLIYPYLIPGNYVMLAVSDNGCGIEKENLDKLFEPFYTSKPVGQGTGLGLSTVYGIIKQNNGFINVYSEPGEGTTFRVYLPAFTQEASTDFCEEKKAKRQAGTETILVVEDEKALLDIYQNLLNRFGYTVLSANTPGEAIHVVDNHDGPIDLLMTDVVMPGMNGRDLAAEIQTRMPDIKLLFMSGYTADIIASNGILDRDFNFINKPFSLNELASKIRDVMDCRVNESH